MTEGAERLGILIVFGTRPEAIKMAPVVAKLKRIQQTKPLVLVTAQHREMLDQVLEHFGIVPDFDLDVMREGQTLTEVTTRSLTGMVEVCQSVRPDLVLVHGDTTTTFSAALGAFYMRIPLGHVEAGLRTHDKYSPYPEEINRHLTGVLADLHFAPTSVAKANLMAEGVDPKRIRVTGNTAIDALLQTVRPDYRFAHPLLGTLDFERRRVVLVEAHRRENWGEPLDEACRALAEVVRRLPEVELIYSVHPNPIVSETVRVRLRGMERVHLLEPLSYPDWVNLMARAHLVVTDSGGLQEEAPSLGKPVVLLRDKTERPEALEAGTVCKIGTDYDRIVNTVLRLLTDREAYNVMARAVNPYGDGKAAERITEAILHRWGISMEQPTDFTV